MTFTAEIKVFIQFRYKQNTCIILREIKIDWLLILNIFNDFLSTEQVKMRRMRWKYGYEQGVGKEVERSLLANF